MFWFTKFCHKKQRKKQIHGKDCIIHNTAQDIHGYGEKYEKCAARMQRNRLPNFVLY
jgi:hypothetical protein